jgi:malate dehydrogenase (oxaloacetate-decarboxylating)
VRTNRRWEYSLAALVAGRSPGADGARSALEALGADVSERTATDGVSRQWVVRAPDERGLRAAEWALRAHLGTALQSCEDRAMSVHAGGVLRTRAVRPIATIDDYALIGDPGAARVARVIRDDPTRARELTTCGNTIAVVSDGSDAPGLGGVAVEAELSFVEGTAVAYASFARFNAVPLVVAARDLSGFIDAVVAVSPTFAGIHLTDVAAPNCFHVMRQLSSRLRIPLLDEHGRVMPVATLAALTNALSVVCKRLEHLRVVVGGVTPAAAGTVLLLSHVGVGEMLVVDGERIVHTDDIRAGSYTRALVARHTNRTGLRGGLRDALVGADVYLRFASDEIDEAAVSSMGADPIVFSLGNAAISDDECEVIARTATVSAGTRTNSTNMITTALVFPGVMRGMIEHHVDRLDLTTGVALATALAGVVVGGAATDRLLPTISDMHVPHVLAAALGRHARERPLARRTVTDGTSRKQPKI